MNRHNRGRALAAAFLVALVGVSVVPTSALGGSSSVAASAFLRPGTQYLGDSAGQVFRLRLRNSASGAPIGAVRITRPSSLWTVIGCPDGPAGWTRFAAADSCEYRSNSGDTDDIPAGSARSFRMKATTGPASNNVWGTWAVTLSSGDDLTIPGNNALASPMPMGLRTRAFSFQIIDAVLSSSSAAVGDPCPASNKAAVAGSTGNFLVVCGRNRTNVAQTTRQQNSKLLGTMVAAHGAFTGGSVPSSSDVVVLGYWNDVQVSANPGSGKAVRLRIGSGYAKTSPVIRIAGFSAVGGPPGNSAPVTNDDPSYSTGEDAQLSVPVSGVLANDTDPDLDILVVASVQGNALNVGSATVTAQGGTVSLAANGSFVFDPKANFTGTDTFTYTVTDGTDGSAEATVSINVTSVNDAPTAANASFSMNENTTANFTIPGVLDDSADIDGDSLQAILVTGPAHAASFGLNIDGSFSYQPAANYTGADSFTWKARDPSNAESAVVTVSITVNAVGGGGGGGGGGCLVSC